MSTQELELSRLEPWLRANVPGFDGPLSAEKFPGGQSNPTFKLTAGEREYVLRRKPPGELLASAHAVDREYRVLDALRDTDVPVPNAVVLCGDDDIIGSMFYVMEHLEGRIFWDPAVPEVDIAERTAIYNEMNRVLSEINKSNHSPLLRFTKERSRFLVQERESTPEKTQSAFINSLRECNQQDRKTKLTREITRVLADVLGVADASQLDADKGFFDQGMDSLLAVKFSEQLRHTIGFQVDLRSLQI